jgi:hypothetical protein
MANLYKAHLVNANLINADLRECILKFGKLSNANLSGAELMEANLIKAELNGAKLVEAKLCRANLAYVNFKKADLTNADLTDANLAGADLSDAKLDGANLEGTIRHWDERSEASNQGINAPYKWEGLYFRSKTEIKIAQALDRAGVLFYPNSKARLNTSEDRDGKESDFLVFHLGKWGILEVDGEPWHPPSRTVHDHERDRLFKAHGIRIVEHYDATRCWEQPDKVVHEFLGILSQA